MSIRDLFAKRDPGASQDNVDTLLDEFDEEMANTRRILESVPEDQFAWKPHEKSFTLGELTSHVAALPIMGAVILTGKGRKPSESTTKAEALEAFDQRVAVAREALAGSTDAHLAQSILVTPTVAKSRGSALHHMISHMIHHRGQLSVYLRLLDVVVPGMYGPSADEKS